MGLKELMTVPEAVQHATEAVAGLDNCFLVGFGRLGPEQHQALQSFGRIGAGTPLEGPVGAAVAALTRNEFVDKHFAALAAARAAVQGAQYDALRAHAAAALGRPLGKPGVETAAVPPQASGPLGTWLESTRHWLMELAIAGFRQLEPQALAPFTATLEHLQGEAQASRVAALLTGFLGELLGAMPVAALPHAPIYRWVDLWTRAMIGALRAPVALTGAKVAGRLTVLGVDLHHHGSFVSFDAYALLEQADSARLVRITQSSYKVDVVLREEMWQCFSMNIDPLIRAIAQRVALKVDGMTLLPTGDLLWDGKATVGKPVDAMGLAERLLAAGAKDAPEAPTVAPADRHPVQIADPIYLTNYQVQKGEPPTLQFADGAELPLAVARISPASELQAAAAAESKAMLGLLRFDGGGWSVQPLAVVGAKAAEYTGSGVYEYVGKKKGATLAVLQERASRLLRQKS
jgi:hypothetical protein